MQKTNRLHHPKALEPIGNNWRSDSLVPSKSVVAIPIHSDNYVWLLHDKAHAWVFDPGIAEPIIQYLHQEQLTLKGVMITHSHWDHVNGINALVDAYPAPVYGPANIHSGVDQPVTQGDVLAADNFRFEVHETPGHMAEHLSFFEASCQLLFCGDTLFSAGCGRLKQTGNMRALFNSLQWIQSLPASTLIFCSHEYTLANLAFAQAAEPDNTSIREYQDDIKQLRVNGRPSLPSTLSTELAINPFLRLPPNSPFLNSEHSRSRFEIFQTLRLAKDHF